MMVSKEQACLGNWVQPLQQFPQKPAIRKFNTLRASQFNSVESSRHHCCSKEYFRMNKKRTARSTNQH
eukprot:769660-Amphidinium_carterae.1